MPPKTLKRYTAAKKLKVIKYAEEKGVRAAAVEFSVSPSCVSEWKKNKDVISAMPKHRKSRGSRKPKWPALENSLAEWVKECRKDGIPISSVKLRLKAVDLAKEANLTGFTANTGWYCRFMKRQKLSIRAKTTAGQKLPEGWEGKVESFKAFVYKTVNENKLDMCNVYNMDEVSLSFDAPPSRTIDCKGVKSVYVKTTGHEKTNFTVVLCCSATGSKLKPLLIFKRVTIPKEQMSSNVVVRANKKGWMNEVVMAEWVEQVYLERETSDSCTSLLILDSMKSHKTDDVKAVAENHDVKLAVIPGGLTKVIQPLDLTINRVFKLEVRKRWEEWMAIGIHTFTKGGKMRKATFGEVSNWVASAWEAVHVSTIVNAFKAAGIVSGTSLQAPSTSSGVTPGTSSGAPSTSTSCMHEPLPSSDSDSECDESYAPVLDVEYLNLFCSDTEDSDFSGFESDDPMEAFCSDNDPNEFEGFDTDSD